MELSPLYLQRLEEATQRGIERGIEQCIQQAIEQGIQQAKRPFVESLLQVYFDEIDEELAQLIEPLIQLEPIEIARLIMLLDRSHLLAHFDTQNQTRS